MVKRGNELILEYSKEDIMKKINSYFGYELINEIKLITTNSEIKKENNNKNLIKYSKNLKKKIDTIKNNDIKKSLSKLLNVINND